MMTKLIQEDLEAWKKLPRPHAWCQWYQLLSGSRCIGQRQVYYRHIGEPHQQSGWSHCRTLHLWKWPPIMVQQRPHQQRLQPQPLLRQMPAIKDRNLTQQCAAAEKQKSHARPAHADRKDPGNSSCKAERRPNGSWCRRPQITAQYGF